MCEITLDTHSDAQQNAGKRRALGAADALRDRVLPLPPGFAKPTARVARVTFWVSRDTTWFTPGVEGYDVLRPTAAQERECRALERAALRDVIPPALASVRIVRTGE